MSDLSTDLWDLLPCGFAPNVSDTIFVIKGFDSSDAASAFGARDCSSGFLCPSQHVLSQHPEIFNLKKKNNPAWQFSTTTRHAFFLQGVCFVRSCGVTSYQLLGEFSGVLVFYTSLRTANFGGVQSCPCGWPACRAGPGVCPRGSLSWLVRVSCSARASGM